MKKKNTEAAISATRTMDGFIEITALEALDEIVGGLVDPETIVCEIVEEKPVSQRRALE